MLLEGFHLCVVIVELLFTWVIAYATVDVHCQRLTRKNGKTKYHHFHLGYRITGVAGK